MKHWMTVVIILVVGLAIFTSGCSQGISTDEYQKTLNELLQAQSQASNLRSEKAALEKQLATLTQKVSELESENDNLKAEVARLKQTGSSSTSGPTPTQQTPSSSVIVVTEEQLERDYEANKLAADIKYKDKILRVTGVVSQLGGSPNDPIIYFKSTGGFLSQSVQAHLKPEYATKVSQMTQGQTVTVQGLFKGFGFLWNEMVDCDLVP